MSLLDGEQPSESSLPDLSWNSISGRDESGPDTDGGSPDQQADDADAAVPVADPSEPFHLDLQLPSLIGSAADADGPAADTDGPSTEPADRSPGAATTEVSGLLPITFSLGSITDGPTADVPATATPTPFPTVPPEPVSPEPVSAEPVSPEPVPAEPAVEPPIVAAAPTAAPVIPEPAVPAAPPPAAVPAAPAAQPAAPAVPEPGQAPPPPMVFTLPDTPAKPAPVTPREQPSQVGYQQLMAAAPPPTTRGRRKRRRGGGVVGLLFTLIVLGGLVAAGFIWGKPYLFPDEWDAATKPYVEAVEAATGDAVVEPFAVVEEEAVTYQRAFDEDYFGEWETDLALWRAFGLADGSANAATLSTDVVSRPDVFYSTSDWDVHQLATPDAASNEAATMHAVAEAVFDQDYRWTQLLGQSTVERDALIRAVVHQEAERLRAETDFNQAMSAPDRQPVGLPALLDHRLMAPQLYAEILGLPETTFEDRLRDLETFAGRLSGSTEFPLGTPAQLAEGQVAAGTAVPMDHTFWYLVLASRLEAPAAFDLTQEITAASLTPVRTADNATCWSAVFDMSTPETGFAMATVLPTWAAAAPIPSAATVQTLDAATVQLTTCDPGMAAATASASATRSLLGYRAAELAVITAVLDRGGTDDEVLAGLELLESSTIGDELAVLPVETTMPTLAAEARARVVPIVDAATAGMPVSIPEPDDVAEVIETVEPVVDAPAGG